MATKKNPEQRTSTSQSTGAAQPTGDEVFDSASMNTAPEPEPVGSVGEEEGAPPSWRVDLEENLRDLEAAATEQFEKLTETANQLNLHARKLYETGQGYTRDHPAPVLGGAFALGILVGMLTARD